MFSCPLTIIQCKASLSSYFISIYFLVCKINLYISTCKLVFFLHFRIKCSQNSGAYEDADFLNNCATSMSLVHFTTLFRMVQETLYFRNHILGMSDEVLLPSVVCAVCKNLYQKLVFCLKIYDSCTN